MHVHIMYYIEVGTYMFSQSGELLEYIIIMQIVIAARSTVS